MRKFLPLLIVLLTAFSFGGWWYVTDILPEKNAEDTSGTPAPGETVEVAVTSSEYSFSPATITVEEGKTVRLTFKNNGSTIHTWTVRGLNADTGLILPGKSKMIDFDAVPAGTYEIYCSVAGHEEAGMVGTLKIE